MTLLSRTAYPRFTPPDFSEQELVAFAPTDEEIRLIQQWNRGLLLQLGFAVQLKVFQWLGYFPELASIPPAVVEHIKNALPFINTETPLVYTYPTTMYRHRQKIREHLGITRWGRQPTTTNSQPVNPARHYAIYVAMEAAQTLNYPADIINRVIEQLRQAAFELPAYHQLDRLVRHTRTFVNRRIFQQVYQQLPANMLSRFDQLLHLPSDYHRTGFDELKTLPKSPTITHFKALLDHHDALLSLGQPRDLLIGITTVKWVQFAEEAKALDANGIRQIHRHKRNTLILCLLRQAQERAKEALAITFCKTLVKIHKHAVSKLEAIRNDQLQKTHLLLTVFSGILVDCQQEKPNNKLLQKILETIQDNGGAEALQAGCEEAAACNTNNYYPLLWSFFATKRGTLFRLLEVLPMHSTTQNHQLILAMTIMMEHRHKRTEFLTVDVDLAFTTQQWRRLIIDKSGKQQRIVRRYFELCIFSHLANELHSGDVFIDNAGSFADYRQDLLPWERCLLQVEAYCREVAIPNNPQALVVELRQRLSTAARRVDRQYPSLSELVIDEKGRPHLKRRHAKRRPSTAVKLDKAIKDLMPERHLLDVLCRTHYYCDWASVYGPLSGVEPKIDQAIERYILTNFAYGTRLGPTQTAKHVKSEVTAHMLSFINRRHVTAKKLDLARTRLVNCYKRFELITAWGDGTSCAADGTLHALQDENLFTEPHFRYGQKGGIAYHHVADNYILLFSTFIPCGVWEAVEIIEGLLRNDSEIQPDIIHADTQGQSTIVFALAYLLGFQLMPRIRHWKDLTLFRPDKASTYQHIDSLFGDPIKWDLIETHWQDMMQVVLSIKAGKASSSVLLRKLGNYSRKNRLYLAFQELGRVIRTEFLLSYIADVTLRESITAATNKVEAYNALSDWVSFGAPKLVASNDDREMEKAIKYNGILTNAVILQNTVDMSNVINQLSAEGMLVRKSDLAYLSPYPVGHLKRFGEFVVDLHNTPEPIDSSQHLALS